MNKNLLNLFQKITKDIQQQNSKINVPRFNENAIVEVPSLDENSGKTLSIVAKNAKSRSVDEARDSLTSLYEKIATTSNSEKQATEIIKNYLEKLHYAKSHKKLDFNSLVKNKYKQNHEHNIFSEKLIDEEHNLEINKLSLERNEKSRKKQILFPVITDNKVKTNYKNGEYSIEYAWISFKDYENYFNDIIENVCMNSKGQLFATYFDALNLLNKNLRDLTDCIITNYQSLNGVEVMNNIDTIVSQLFNCQIKTTESNKVKRATEAFSGEPESTVDEVNEVCDEVEKEINAIIYKINFENENNMDIDVKTNRHGIEIINRKPVEADITIQYKDLTMDNLGTTTLGFKRK